MFELGSVLVVDDNPLNVTLARDTLEEAGYEVMDVPNASEGIEVIKTLHPDIAIMDIMMPGLAGDEATRMLKSDPDTSSTRIIIVSAKATPDDIVSGFQCRADDYLTKPYYPQVLLARVRTQMIVRQAQRILMTQKEKLENEVTEQSARLQKTEESREEPPAHMKR